MSVFLNKDYYDAQKFYKETGETISHAEYGDVHNPIGATFATLGPSIFLKGLEYFTENDGENFKSFCSLFTSKRTNDSKNEDINTQVNDNTRNIVTLFRIWTSNKSEESKTALQNAIADYDQNSGNLPPHLQPIKTVLDC